MVTRKLLVCAGALAACGKFQDPNIAVDLRVLAMTASVPEQVVDVDPTNPDISQLLPQLVASEVCALVTDPNSANRRLRWSMVLCPEGSDDRCDDSAPQVLLGQALSPGPDNSVPEPRMCATVQPDANLVGILVYSLKNDILRALQGEQYMVMLHVGEENGDPTLDVYAAKALQITLRVPADRTPNQNPYLNEIDATLPGADPVPLPMGRCIDQSAPLEVPPSTKVRLTPIEPDGIHETYTIELLDGTFATFTESISYQWTAAGGSYSSGDTGGPHDRFGNLPPLFTDWTSPSKSDLGGLPTDIALWVVQRDERLGAAWYETCIRVVP